MLDSDINFPLNLSAWVSNRHHRLLTWSKDVADLLESAPPIWSSGQITTGPTFQLLGHKNLAVIFDSSLSITCHFTKSESSADYNFKL